MAIIYKLDFQREIIKLLCTNDTFIKMYFSETKAEYFEDKIDSMLFLIISDYINLYQRPITPEYLEREIIEYTQKRGYGSDMLKALKDNAKAIFRQPITNEDYIISIFAEFARSQAMKNAILKSVDIMETSENYEAVLKLVEEASTVGRGQDNGASFSDFYSLKKELHSLYDSSKLVPTGIPTWDKALGGGIGPGELHTIISPPKPLVGETKIPLLNGEDVYIKDLLGREPFWVYGSKEDGTVIPVLARDVHINRYESQLVKITLDNNEVITSTLDHEHMLRDGSYLQAKDLKPGVSMMPFYTKKKEKGSYLEDYLLVKDNSTNKFKFIHTLVAECFLSKKTRDGKVVHHVDHNKYNNNPENLVKITSEEHSRYHMNKGWESNSLLRVNHSKEVSERNRKRWSTDADYRLYMESILSENSKKLALNVEDKKKQSSLGGKIAWEKHKDRFLKEKSDLMKTINKDSDIIKKKVQSRKTSHQLRITTDIDYVEKLQKWGHNLQEAYINKKQTDSDFWQRRLEKYKDPKVKQKTMLTRCNKVVTELSKLGLEINKENYTEELKRLDSTGNRIHNKNIPSYEKYLLYKDNFNHKIQKVEFITLEKAIPVYCMTVDETHNFALSAGIFTHNCGKSTLGVNIGFNAMLRGKKVFHVSLENMEALVKEKYALLMTRSSYRDLRDMSQDEYEARLKKFEKLNPNLFIKYWPEKSVNTLTVRAWISSVRVAKGVKPDLIILDYDDCLLPTPRGKGKVSDSYEESGDIYTDLIQLANNFHCPILTFSQPGRAAWTKMRTTDTPVFSEDVAHSARKIHRAFSISSLNFKPGEDKGTMYIDRMRRGQDGISIPMYRDLFRGVIREVKNMED
jgi:hypothetical protein